METTDTFSVSKIETAVEIISSQQDNRMKEAVEFLEKWEQNSNCIFIACEALLNSENQRVRFLSTVILDHKIPRLWGSVSKEDQDKIRNFLVQQLSVPSNQSIRNIIDTLIKGISHIGVFDFPEVWPDFQNLLLPESDNYFSFKFLETFFDDVEKSDAITEQRRQSLRSILLSKSDVFFLRIQNAFLSPESNVFALNTYTNFIQWAPRTMITQEIVIMIIKEFLPSLDNDTSRTAVNCIETIFLKRTDSHKNFHNFYVQLIEGLTTVQTSNGQAVTCSVFVVKFIIKLFVKQINDLIRWVTEENPQLHEKVVQLITVLLSLREDVPKKLWLLFYLITSQIVEESLSDQFGEKYNTNFFLPILSIIRTNLFQILPLSTDSDGILIPIAQNCFAKMIEVDYQAMLQFMESQEPSPSLCYALGCLMLVRAPSGDIAIAQIIQQLSDESHAKLSDEVNGPAYIIPVLYGLSRSSFCLQIMDLFDIFIELTIDCLQSATQALSNAASHALLYVAQNHVKLFKAEGSTAVQDFIAMSELYMKLSEASAIRMFNCVNLLLSEPEQFKTLYEPVILALNNYENTTGIGFALNIILETSHNKSIGLQFLPFVLPVILQLCQNIIPNQSVGTDCMDLLMNSLSSLLICSQIYNAEIDTTIRGVFQLFIQRQQTLACLFDFIASLRLKFSELGELFDEIMKTFVLPIFENPASDDIENAPIAEIMLMISRFKGTSVNIEWLLKVCIEIGIKSLQNSTNLASAKCLYRVFREMDTPQLRQIFQSCGVSILSEIFSALGDSMHKPAFRPYTKLVRNICLLLLNSHTAEIEPTPEIIELLTNSLAKAFQHEPSERMFIEFATFLGHNLTKYEDFAEGFANFLIMMNKVSPGDAEMFKIYDTPADLMEKIYEQVVDEVNSILVNET